MVPEQNDFWHGPLPDALDKGCRICFRYISMCWFEDILYALGRCSLLFEWIFVGFPFLSVPFYWFSFLFLYCSCVPFWIPFIFLVFQRGVLHFHAFSCIFLVCLSGALPFCLLFLIVNGMCSFYPTVGIHPASKLSLFYKTGRARWNTNSQLMLLN